MASCQGCGSTSVRNTFAATCSGCSRKLTLCKRCLQAANNREQTQSSRGHHCSEWQTTLSETRCARGAAMVWRPPGVDPEQAQKKLEDELRMLKAMQEAMLARHAKESPTEGVTSASACANAEERLTIQRQVKILAAWKKRPCTCKTEHAKVDLRGQGRIIVPPETMSPEQERSFQTSLSRHALRRIMQIHKICTPTDTSRTNLSNLRGRYLNGTICVTVLARKGQYKILLTNNVTQTSDRMLCVLKADGEWVNEPDPIRYSVRGTDRNYYLYRMCPSEPLKTTGDSGANNTCTTKHVSNELETEVFIHDARHPNGCSLHHAEMQAVHYAFRYGWDIIAMAPSRPCCELCAGTLEGLGLMGLVQHPHQWGFGEGTTDFQTLGNLSDEAYLKHPFALKDMDAKAIEAKRADVANADSVLKRKRGGNNTDRDGTEENGEEAEENDEEAEETPTASAPMSTGEDETESAHRDKVRRLTKSQDGSTASSDVLSAPFPTEVMAQVEALQTDKPLVEKCPWPKGFWFWEEDDPFNQALVPEAGHAAKEVLGVVNAGNSCYLNSVLQLLIHTRARTNIQAHFLDNTAGSLDLRLQDFLTTYPHQAANGTYIEKSATHFYTTAQVTDIRLKLFHDRIVGGMLSQEDAALVLTNIVSSYGVTLNRRLTKRFHLDATKIALFPAHLGMNADDHGNTVVPDVLSVLPVQLHGVDATGRAAAVTLASVLDANEVHNHAVPVAGTTVVNNQGNVYENVNLLEERWAWHPAAPTQFFFSLQRFFYTLGAAGKNRGKVDVPLTLVRWGNTYHLYGFIVHIGNALHFGHYVTYLRSPTRAGVWYYINDEHVTELAHDSVALTDARQSGYVYFYGP